jgi:hypothetical protein
MRTSASCRDIKATPYELLRTEAGQIPAAAYRRTSELCYLCFLLLKICLCDLCALSVLCESNRVARSRGLALRISIPF